MRIYQVGRRREKGGNICNTSSIWALSSILFRCIELHKFNDTQKHTGAHSKGRQLLPQLVALV